MANKLGRVVKSGVITFHSIGAIFRYMKSNIKNKFKKDDENDNDINIDKMNIKNTIEVIKSSEQFIIRPGVEKALDELRKAYVHAGEQINKLDKTILNINSKEEFNGIKDNLEASYKKIMDDLNASIEKAKFRIQDEWIQSDNVDKIKKNCIEYLDRVFNINKNSKNFRSMNKEEFMNHFNFDASKIFDLYKTIPYKNLNEIPIFCQVLNNIKIGLN